MSLHYDFALACDLKEDTPQQVIDTLAYMTRRKDYFFDNPPAHPFFEGDWWRDFLQIDADATYFPGDNFTVFRKAYRHSLMNVDHYRYTLSFRCYMLDDIFHETWWSFSDWLAPYNETEGCVGYYREEADWQPTLIYFKNGVVYIVKVKEKPIPMTADKEW